MCVSDWRLGMLIRTNSFPWTTLITSPIGFNANQNRVGLLIEIIPATEVLTAEHTVTFSDGTTIVIGDTRPPLMLTVTMHGILPTLAFSISKITTVRLGQITEFLLPTPYLQASLKQFESEYAQWLASK